MLKYPCLVLDHDDTVVASEIAVNYPCFLEGLKKFRPGEYMDHPEFVRWCFDYEFADFLRVRYGFTPEEAKEEYEMWKEYAKTHIPPVCDGIKEIILEQKRRGGLVCVASLSSRETILRDYDLHIGIRPDLIFSSDDPLKKRKPGTHPLEAIMEAYHLSPADLLVVDDLKTGLQMAKAASVPIAAALWCRQDAPELIEYMTSRCDFAFHTTGELYDFLFHAGVKPHSAYTLHVCGGETYCDRGPVAHISAQGCDLTVRFRSGETARWSCKFASAYNHQFGIAPSPDGTRLFLQTWENGLLCFDSKTGEQLWRTKSKRGVTNLFVGANTIACQQHDHALLLLDMENGQVLKEKRPSTAWGFTNLDDRHIVCRSTARRWELIDGATLEVLESWSHAEFTAGHTDYLVNRIKKLDARKMEIRGFQNQWGPTGNLLPNLEFTHILKTKTEPPV